MKLDNKVYDILKWIAQYFLPAAATLYFTLSETWGLPYGDQVVGTISAIDLFLGALLGISSASYKGDGTIQVDTTDPEKDTYRLVLNIPVEELPNKKMVTLYVDPIAEITA